MLTAVQKYAEACAERLIAELKYAKTWADMSTAAQKSAENKNMVKHGVICQLWHKD